MKKKTEKWWIHLYLPLLVKCPKIKSGATNYLKKAQNNLDR